MKITKEDILEYQSLMLTDYGVNVDYYDAQRQLENLLNFYKIIQDVTHENQ